MFFPMSALDLSPDPEEIPHCLPVSGWTCLQIKSCQLLVNARVFLFITATVISRNTVQKEMHKQANR